MLHERCVNHAVLQSRYHNVLIAAYQDSTAWKPEVVSTVAVYQPDDPRAKGLRLWHEYGLRIVCEQQESHRFDYIGGKYVLQESYIQASSEMQHGYIQHPKGLLFWDADTGGLFEPAGDALWRRRHHAGGIQHRTDAPLAGGNLRKHGRLDAAGL